MDANEGVIRFSNGSFMRAIKALHDQCIIYNDLIRKPNKKVTTVSRRQTVTFREAMHALLPTTSKSYATAVKQYSLWQLKVSCESAIRIAFYVGMCITSR